MRFGSVCSGIEAASVAWNPLGWTAAWLSEIEPFPSAVLAHHYPDVPNLGDMTTLPERIRSGEVEGPDLFCGGTPCQAFSVAGLRKSLDDARGNLSLTFCEIANAIDDVRSVRGDAPAIIFWENVPGVLSTKDNAFGCFLAGLAGEDDPLVPAGGKWTNAGVVLGPQRTVAWRVLDAQYFGVAQRRRRVFVVASARDGFDPAAVLFEFDGVRRDTAPSREAGKVAPTIPSRSTAGGGLGTDFDCDGGVIQQTVQTLRTRRPGEGGMSGDDEHLVPVVSPALNTCSGSHHAPDTKAYVVQPVTQFGDTAGTLTARHDSSPCADRGMNVVAFHPTQDPISSVNVCHSIGANDNATAAVAVALRGREGGATAELGDDVQNCLRASQGGGDKPHVMCETLYNEGFNHGGLYASTQETHAGKILRTLREAVGEKAFAKWGLGILDSLQSPEVLRQALHGVSIRPAAFSRSWVVHCALSRSQNSSGWLLQSLREAGCERCASQGWQPPEQLARELGAYLSELSQPGAQAKRFVCDLWIAAQGAGILREALSALQEMGRPAGRQGKPIHSSEEGTGAAGAEELQGAGLLREVSREGVLQQARAAGEARNAGEATIEQVGGRAGPLAQTMMVRRLTCEEAEFLQGFPRGYTAIPWRKKPASECPDGPRYKALGNSWAVPVVRWIGKRIQEAA